MSQKLKPKPKRKRKKEEKPSFEAGRVFTKPESDVEISEILDSDSARFKAKKGQGGDRRG